MSNKPQRETTPAAGFVVRLYDIAPGATGANRLPTTLQLGKAAAFCAENHIKRLKTAVQGLINPGTSTFGPPPPGLATQGVLVVKNC